MDLYGDKDFARYEGSLFAFVAGFLIGPIIGGALGFELYDWSGAVLGAFGGLVLGPPLLGGAVGCMSGSGALVRAAAGPLLAFGVFSAAGTTIGVWLGSGTIAHLSPATGFFLGLGIPGYIAGRIVAWLMDGDTDELLLLLLTVAGAGGGAAFAATGPGGPGSLAVLVVLGSFVGMLATALTHAAIADIQDLRSRRNHRYR